MGDSIANLDPAYSKKNRQTYMVGNELDQNDPIDVLDIGEKLQGVLRAGKHAIIPIIENGEITSLSTFRIYD